MQIQIASDLHFETRNQAAKKSIIQKLKDNNDCKTIILAGDISSFNHIEKDLLLFRKCYDQVVYINGNHEVWGTTLENLHIRKNSLADGIHWLENDIINLNNVEFIGCTLWFPDQVNNKNFDWFWPDFKYIKNSHQIYEQNKYSQKFLKNTISENSVVITHHFPSPKSIHFQYKDDCYNRYFLCNMEETMNDKKPKLWIHGHTHHKFDYCIGNTRIISNPLGYPNEFGIGDFDWNKVVEI